GPDRGPFHVVITPRPLAYFYTATVAGFCSAVDKASSAEAMQQTLSLVRMSTCLGLGESAA
ncbi:hypothetical protein, partial [Sphingomonas metalli]|uniref:hypothetical protein n=1 Tax=Sphingomonas metalli TaxID=1779358 RepID=UPI001E5FC9C1